MKTCLNCGQVNNEDTHVCEGCGAKLPESNELEPLSSPTQHESISGYRLPSVIKWCFFLAAWGFVLTRCLVWNPQSILATPFFPIGLAAWLPNGEEKAIFVWFVGGWIIGWAIYAFLSFLIFKIKNVAFFFFIYVLFFLLLMLNVAGCKRIMEVVSGIH